MVETGLLNAIVTGIVTGSIVALGAIGLALVYSIAEVPNFAHGELLTIGAYLALLVNKPDTVPVFTELAPELQGLGTGGFAILFLLAAGATLGAVYLLGGRPALEGSWWPVDVPPGVGLAGTAAGAAVVGGLVVVGFPSIWAGVLLSALLLAVGAPLAEKFVFRKFRDKDASLATMLIVALGLSFVLRFGTQAVFSGRTRFYVVPRVGEVFGQEVSLSSSRFFDFYLSNGGLVLEVLASEVVNSDGGDPTLLLAGYGWPALVAILAGTLLAGYGAYRYRSRGPYTSGTFGPRLTAVVTGFLAFAVLAVVLATDAVVPSDPIAASRVKLSLVRGGVVVIALAMMASLHVLLQETKLGTAMRASSDNKDLARVTGINTNKVMMSTWILAGSFAAVGGVMLGILFSTLRINMGFFLLLPMFAGVILGGLGSVYGAILGSFLVGIAMDVGIYWFDISAVYRVPVAFVLLFVVLLVKPEGITGGGA